MNYRQATPDVVKMGHDLIAEHHPHLLGSRVDFVFMDKTPKKGGKQVWGRTKKISSLPAFLSNPGEDRTRYGFAEDFFVIEIVEEIWQALKPPARKALIDHELSHCEIVHGDDDADAKLGIVGHDVTEFSAIIERHGLWNASLEDFVEKAQPSLEDFREESEGALDSDDAPQAGRTETFHFDSEQIEQMGRVAEAVRGSGVMDEADPETGEVLEPSARR